MVIKRQWYRLCLAASVAVREPWAQARLSPVGSRTGLGMPLTQDWVEVANLVFKWKA